jgi:hypothetical protein
MYAPAPSGSACFSSGSTQKLMQLQPSDSLLQDLPEDSSAISRQTKERLLIDAFEALPDAVYLFGSDRQLVRIDESVRK